MATEANGYPITSRPFSRKALFQEWQLLERDLP